MLSLSKINPDHPFFWGLHGLLIICQVVFMLVQTFGGGNAQLQLCIVLIALALIALSYFMRNVFLGEYPMIKWLMWSWAGIAVVYSALLVRSITG